MFLEMDTIEIIVAGLQQPQNMGLLLVLVSASCRLGMHAGIVDDTYESEVGYALAVGFAFVLYAIAVYIRTYLG